MFRKLFALMMVFSIFTVQAHATSQSGLKQAFDELNYALTVEWNQKDKDFHNEQMKKFYGTLRDLQTKGLTNAELLDFIKTEVKDEKVARDVETAFNMIQINKMSSDEASNYMIETMRKSYSAGASFNGEIFLYLGIGLLIVVAAVALSGSSSSSSSSSSGGGYTCYDDCYPQYYNCGGYYSNGYWYDYTCSETVCDTYCY
ncbi:MAG: hypothetical protein NDI69_04025 [Bacteriovoracaceae bacterium]|nr:hypothetical protein [Bacteriovoracaceae bacterium]